MSTGTSCDFGHLLQISKKISLKSDFIRFFFMILYMYIGVGQRQTAPREQSFDVNRNVLSLHSFVASFKKMSSKSDFVQFFHDLIMYIAPGQGQTAPGGKILMSTERPYHFTHLLQVSKKSLKSDFIQFLS